jgi:hypothetical protein
MPKCAKCGGHFQCHTVIDGKERNLCSRKFCLSCSPFGRHNTRDITDDDNEMKTCYSCSRQLPKSAFLRRRRSGVYAFYGSCKECRASYDKKRALLFKLRCIAYKGGKCEVCGYSKCVGALDFHHADPVEKEFALGGQKTRKFDSRIRRELDKCVLLCCRCHREEHTDDFTLKYDLPDLLTLLEQRQR